MTPDEYDALRKDFGAHNAIVRCITDMSPSARVLVDPIRAIHTARWANTDANAGRMMHRQLTLRDLLTCYKEEIKRD